MALNIGIEKRKLGHFLVKLEGRLDGLTAPDCEAKIEPLLAASTRSIVLDLAKLDYISSMGLRVILAARKSLANHKGELLLTHMQAPIAKVFEIAKIMPGTFIFESVKSADIYLDAVQRREILKNENLPE
ncbi:MAG: STAS domain-containing protein [Verrucomicrobia bacterium]|nr:STAS domain-containing protein [Verrucomicrobiota bacterium]MBU4292055.1 STAS domain-containing protein [Verrucomicrobiota bacterium]MBU4428146.1 STAS domain-containing protein [Verrucomicrobiota bacterium]MCG2678889.1 STAS domain-containing protein [Kiritimatiellia bacterium]